MLTVIEKSCICHHVCVCARAWVLSQGHINNPSICQILNKIFVDIERLRGCVYVVVSVCVCVCVCLIPRTYTRPLDLSNLNEIALSLKELPWCIKSDINMIIVVNIVIVRHQKLCLRTSRDIKIIIVVNINSISLCVHPIGT